MIKRFDYINASVDELANFVEESTSQKISLSLIYHTKHGNVEIVEKIKEARKIVKKRKMLKAISEM